MVERQKEKRKEAREEERGEEIRIEEKEMGI